MEEQTREKRPEQVPEAPQGCLERAKEWFKREGTDPSFGPHRLVRSSEMVWPRKPSTGASLAWSKGFFQYESSMMLSSWVFPFFWMFILSEFKTKSSVWDKDI